MWKQTLCMYLHLRLNNFFGKIFIKSSNSLAALQCIGATKQHTDIQNAVSMSRLAFFQ